ncbi:MAG: hypothetical protein JW763_04190 [candidate division Zixibacteria bacterium]|nr:hypothetical protein [candidate division Zixibacteria bacterium]
MTTEKQIEANRLNALKSTGPRTPEGKHVSSRNATKHGMYSRDIVIDSSPLKENRRDYEDLIQSLLDELCPVGQLEEYLVVKIANCLWRSARIIRAETANLTKDLESVYDYQCQRGKSAGEENTKEPDATHARLMEYGHLIIPRGETAADILRYEMRLDRQLTRTYDLLRQHQNARRKTDGKNDIEPDKNIGESNPF